MCIERYTLAHTYCAALLALIAIAFSPLVLSTEAGERSDPGLVIAFDNYAPYHYWDGNIPKGLNIELINELFSRINKKAHYIRRPWKRSLHDLKTGEVAALCAGMKNPEREKYSYYPSRHLSLETNWVISLAESNITVTGLDDLTDLRIGTVSSYSYGPSFDSLKGLNTINSKNEDALLDLLLNERVDVIIGSDLVVSHIAQSRDLKKKFKFQLKLTSDPLYLLLSKEVQGNDKLNELVSAGLSKMVIDGTYQRILRKYSGMLEIPTYSVTTDYWPPFRMQTDNGITGIDVDLLNEIGKRLGIKFVWHRRPWVRCLAEIESGLADITTGIAYTEERDVYTSYSSLSYYETGPAFYLHDEERAKSIKSYDDLYPLSIGFTRGSAYFKQFDADSRLNKKVGNHEALLINMVIAKRWDALIGTDVQVEYDLAHLNHEEGRTLYKASYVPRDRIKLYLGLSDKSKLIEKLPDINAVLDQLIKDGTVKKIVSNYIQ